MTQNLPARINGRFVPGQSGNAGGRPHAYKEFTELARSFAPDALRTLREIANDSNAQHFARIAAAEAILNRGFGRPVQGVAVAVDANANPQTVDAMLVALREGGPLTRERFQPIIDAQQADEES